MRTRMYGGVRGRKTKVGGKSTFVFLLLDYLSMELPDPMDVCPFELHLSMLVHFIVDGTGYEYK